MNMNKIRPKKHVCIIAFSVIKNDARVLRQIEYLAPHYEITVIGFGEPHPDWTHLNWMTVHKEHNHPRFLRGFFALNNRLGKFLNRCIIACVSLVGVAYSKVYELHYRTFDLYRNSLQHALNCEADIYHANDWNTLPIAAAAIIENNAKLVFDAHEYAPKQSESIIYRLFIAPRVIYFLRRYACLAHATITVSGPIKRLYAQNFGFDPIVIMNAPAEVPLPESKTISENVRLIHHGGSARERRIDLLIKIVSQLDQRFSLHLMLVGRDVHSLKQLAIRIAPNRVVFEDPVPPGDIVAKISEYDMGIHVLLPINLNHRLALPNKFFDFICAGLAVCIGPSPAMAELVEQYEFGCVAQSFEVEDIIRMLNNLTTEEIISMKKASLKAKLDLNAETEMAKLIELYYCI